MNAKFNTSGQFPISTSNPQGGFQNFPSSNWQNYSNSSIKNNSFATSFPNNNPSQPLNQSISTNFQPPQKTENLTSNSYNNSQKPKNSGFSMNFSTSFQSGNPPKSSQNILIKPQPNEASDFNFKSSKGFSGPNKGTIKKELNINESVKIVQNNGDLDKSKGNSKPKDFLYSKENDLRKEEKDAFLAKELVMFKVPYNPPSKRMCGFSDDELSSSFEILKSLDESEVEEEDSEIEYYRKLVEELKKENADLKSKIYAEKLENEKSVSQKLRPRAEKCKELESQVEKLKEQVSKLSEKLKNESPKEIPSLSRLSSYASTCTSYSSRCQATTLKGNQCKRGSQPGRNYCWQH